MTWTNIVNVPGIVLGVARPNGTDDPRIGYGPDGRFRIYAVGTAGVTFPAIASTSSGALAVQVPNFGQAQPPLASRVTATFGAGSFSNYGFHLSAGYVNPTYSGEPSTDPTPPSTLQITGALDASTPWATLADGDGGHFQGVDCSLLIEVDVELGPAAGHFWKNLTRATEVD